jgi:hypothetical protein
MDNYFYQCHVTAGSSSFIPLSLRPEVPRTQLSDVCEETVAGVLELIKQKGWKDNLYVEYEEVKDLE